MARGGTVTDERPAALGALQPSWPALAGLTLAAIAGFVGVGFLIDVPGDLMGTYIALVCAWWLTASLALGLTVPAVSAWPPAAMAIAQGAILIVTWGAAFALSISLGLERWWIDVGLRLPVCIILVAGFGQVLRSRELSALMRAERERTLAHIETETHALIEAHAAIVEEARAASSDVTAAVRAALRLSHSQGVQDATIRALLDSDVRRRASDAGRRIHEIRSEPESRETPPLQRLGPWLDDLAFAPSWHIPLAFGLLLTTLVIADLSSPTWQEALPFIFIGATVGCLVAIACAARARPRIAMWSPLWRRLAFPGSLVLGLAIALPVSALGATTDAADIALASLARMPAALAVVALPGAYSAAVRRSRVYLSEADGRIALATARRDMAQADLEQARRAVVSTLHTYVQGRAVAALTALELADQGVSGAEDIVDAVLTELADLDVVRSAQDSVLSKDLAWPTQDMPWIDPVQSVIDSWRRVLDIAIDDHFLGSRHLRYRVATHIDDALVNAAIHGQARCIDISLTVDDGAVHLRVRDDGLGIAGEIRPGLGLTQMKERGGSWHLDSAPGSGTVLTVRLPIPPCNMTESSSQDVAR